MSEVHLHDASGQHLTTEEHDGDPDRAAVIQHDGHSYVWDQRNAQWRQATDVVKLGKAKVETKDETKEPAKAKA